MTDRTSNQHFNQLAPVETELLALLSEECGEVVQVIGKILRHGLESQHPDGGMTNRELLQKEMGDVRAAMILLCESAVTSKQLVHEWADCKREKVQQFLHHATVSNAVETTCSGWQPIATAPKDGTTVLLFGPKGLVEGSWECVDGGGHPENGPSVYWWISPWTEFIDGPHDMPTHWMPFPALPPKTSGDVP